MKEKINLDGGWDYRIIYHPPIIIKKRGIENIADAYYAIHEVYYDDNGKPEAYSISPELTGEEIEDETRKADHKSSLESLKTCLKYMTDCLEKPILQKDTFFNGQ